MQAWVQKRGWVWAFIFLWHIWKIVETGKIDDFIKAEHMEWRDEDVSNRTLGNVYIKWLVEEVPASKEDSEIVVWEALEQQLDAANRSMER